MTNLVSRDFDNRHKTNLSWIYGGFNNLIEATCLKNVNWALWAPPETSPENILEILLEIRLNNSSDISPGIRSAISFSIPPDVLRCITPFSLRNFFGKSFGNISRVYRSLQTHTPGIQDFFF